MRVTKPVEERRQEIVDISRELFTQQGFSNTTIADISTEMHIAQGLVYHYFDSKLDILYAVVDQLIAEQVSEAHDTIHGFKGTARECIGELLAQEMQHKALGKLLPSLISDKGIMEYSQKKIAALLVPLFESLIVRGNKDGSLDCPYPKETAIVILQGISGLIDFETIDSDMKDLAIKQSIVGNMISRLLGFP